MSMKSYSFFLLSIIVATISCLIYMSTIIWPARTATFSLEKIISCDKTTVFSLMKDPMNLALVHPHVVNVEVTDYSFHSTEELYNVTITENMPFLGELSFQVNISANKNQYTILNEAKVYSYDLRVEYTFESRDDGITQVHEHTAMEVPRVLVSMFKRLAKPIHRQILDNVETHLMQTGAC